MTDILISGAVMPDLIYSPRRRPSADRGLPARRIAMRARHEQERRLGV